MNVKALLRAFSIPINEDSPCTFRVLAIHSSDCTPIVADLESLKARVLSNKRVQDYNY